VPSPGTRANRPDFSTQIGIRLVNCNAERVTNTPRLTGSSLIPINPQTLVTPSWLLSAPTPISATHNNSFPGPRKRVPTKPQGLDPRIRTAARVGSGPPPVLQSGSTYHLPARSRHRSDHVSNPRRACHSHFRLLSSECGLGPVRRGPESADRREPRSCRRS